VGQHDVDAEADEAARRVFAAAILDDFDALERLIAEDRFERGTRRIGAEQELFLVDAHGLPAPVGPQILEANRDPRLVSELAQFNLEANLTPRPWGGRALSALEGELDEVLALARRAARAAGADVALFGILPTLRETDLSLDKMTPSPRYHALNRAMTERRGGSFAVDIGRDDQLQLAHDNVMLEACNTSFQLHVQVAPDEVDRWYNAAQAAAGPVLAAAVNAPLFLGRRLWPETRVALFERAVDERSPAQQQRGHAPRVTFGNDWLRGGAAELFREDIARFRILLTTQPDRPPAAGEAPKLTALRLHSGTIYRWNRVCYGITDGKPHLRIEHRVLPAGPTVRDEAANAAFFYGLCAALVGEHGDVARVMRFDAAKSNFFAAAREGLDASLAWRDTTARPAASLILEELLPAARRGLTEAGFDRADVERTLGVIEARVQNRQTGAAWVSRSLEAMGDCDADARDRALVTAAIERQQRGEPVHAWPLVEQAARPRYATVGELMTRDLYTVAPDDLAALAARVMRWNGIHHLPVEDAHGRLVGMLTLARLDEVGGDRAVGEVMDRDPIAVDAATETRAARELMHGARVDSLPVIEPRGDRLVGLVTARDFDKLR